MLIGVATGRGQSVKKQLRERMDRAFWDRIPIAYHNGLEIGLLSDEDVPGRDREPIPPLDAILTMSH